MKSLKTNALANMSVRILNIIFPLITGPYLARILSKQDFGEFNSINTLVFFIVPFATFGVYNYGVRVISEVKDQPDKINVIFSALFYISVITTAITSIAYYCYAHLMAPLELKPLYYVLGVQIVVQALCIEWMNEAFENYGFILIKSFAIRMFMVATIFLFVRSEHDIVPYAWIMSLATGFNYLISFIWIKRNIRFQKVTKTQIKKLIKPLLALLLLANANNLYTMLDRAFLVALHQPIMVSYYTLSMTMIQILIGIITGLVSVSVPRLGYYLGCGRRADYENLVNKGSAVFSFFIVPMAVGMMLLGKDAMLLYGGEKYIDAGLTTSLFAIRMIPLSLEMIIGTQIIFLNGFETKLTMYNLAGGLLNLGLNSALSYGGIIRPEYYVITTIVAEVFIVVLDIRFIIKQELFDLRSMFRKLLEYLIIALGFIPIAFVVKFLHPVETVINLPFLINVSLIVVLCAVYYFVILHIRKDPIYMEFYNTASRMRKKILRRS